MKKLAILAVIGIMSISLFGCVPTGEEEVKRIEKDSEVVAVTVTEKDNPTETVGNVTTDEPKGFGYDAVSEEGSMTVYVGTTEEELIAGLGKANSVFEAPSCALEGMDQVYTYDHCEICVTTYPEGKFVSAIYLTDDLSSTKEGLAIGDSKEKMEELYGTNYEENGFEYTYTSGGMHLRVQFTNDVVSYIYYMVDLQKQ